MKKTLLTMMAATAALLTTAQPIEYPKAAKDKTIDTYFGTKVKDPYRWLENDTSRQTAAWVKTENKVTNDYLSRIPFRQQLVKRLREVVNYDAISAPVRHNGKWYFSKREGLKNQAVIYQADELGGEARVFLDPNTLSNDGTVALNGIYHSHNGRWAAYSISRSGSDWQEFYVIDMKTGQLAEDHIEWAKFSGAAWQGDGFYYSAYDRPEAGKEFSNVNATQKIYYHKMGTPQSEDVLFYQNPQEPKRFYFVTTNEEETVMFLFESGAGDGNNLFVKDLRRKDSPFVQATTDMNYQYSPVVTDDNHIYIFTNYQAPKGRLMVADIQHPELKNWREVVGEQQEVLTDVTAVNCQLIMTYQKDASDHAFVYTMDGQRKHEVKLPTVGSVSFYGKKNEPWCFYHFTSFTVPGTIYRYDLTSNESTRYAQPKVNFRPDDFQTEQVFFNSKDGTRVPMFLVYKKKEQISPERRPRPVFLYGYGGFNISLTPYFSAMRIPFLEQGGIYVQVNLRGGSEYGEEWHKAGTKMQKQNVFDDFIAAAEYLIKEGYTTKEQIAIVGGSNGGLLVGACMTQRPDLFRVAIPQVGVMDMLRYHKFTIGWNWASDYGTSEDSKEMFRYLKGYSPLHNLKPGVRYPATLITTADHDDRVVPAHSFKFAATLQECQAATQQKSKEVLPPTLIRIDSKAGHGAGKPLAKQIEEQADIYSFILYNMGLTYKNTNDSEDFVMLTDVVPDAILEMRYFGTYNFVGQRIDGYEQPVALLTRQAADSLKAVSDDVKRQGYRLKIYDTYRPQRAVDHFVRWAKEVNDTLMKPYFYPDLRKEVLFPQLYIDEYSGHTRGSTIDLTIFDMQTEKELDMGGTFDWFGPESHPDFCGNPETMEYTGNNSKSPKGRSITPQQFRNRMILRQAMLRHGFKPFDTEWWHFTLKDEPYPDTFFSFPVSSISSSNLSDHR